MIAKQFLKAAEMFLLENIMTLTEAYCHPAGQFLSLTVQIEHWIDYAYHYKKKKCKNFCSELDEEKVAIVDELLEHLCFISTQQKKKFNCNLK